MIDKNELIVLKCKNCGDDTTGKRYRLSTYKKEGKMCDSCRRNLSSKILTELRSKQSPEEKSKHAKIARSSSKAENRSFAVKKQWEQFRSDPEKYAQICKAKSERMKTVWKKLSQKQKEHIITSLYSSHGKSRSKTSEKLKQDIIDIGLYDGFESEVCIDKYIVDECNKDKKIIIEFYGDAYHCNPKKYKDKNKFVKLIQRTVEEQWDRDKKRICDLESIGYKVLIIWEGDYNKQHQSTLEKIKNFIENSDES